MKSFFKQLFLTMLFALPLMAWLQPPWYAAFGMCYLGSIVTAIYMRVCEIV